MKRVLEWKRNSPPLSKSPGTCDPGRQPCLTMAPYVLALCSMFVLQCDPRRHLGGKTLLVLCGVFWSLTTFAQSIQTDRIEIDSYVETAAGAKRDTKLATNEPVKSALTGQAMIEMMSGATWQAEDPLAELCGIGSECLKAMSSAVAESNIKQNSDASVSVFLNIGVEITSSSSIDVSRRSGLFGWGKERATLREEAAAIGRSIAKVPIAFSDSSIGRLYTLTYQRDGQNVDYESYWLIGSDGTRRRLSNDKEKILVRASANPIVFEADVALVRSSASDEDGQTQATMVVNLSVSDEIPGLPIAENIEPEPVPASAGGGLESRFAQVVSINRNNGEQWCSGTIVGRQTVLTAAHCLEGLSISQLRVVVGFEALRATNKNTYNVEGCQIPSGVDVGLDYDSNIYADDIGLLFVDRPFEKDGSAIPPLKLHDGQQSIFSIQRNRIPLTFVGYGFAPRDDVARDGKNVRRSVLLRPVNISSKTFSNESTQQRWCKGDSGGPGLLEDEIDSDATIVGIVSKGYNRGDGPVVENCYIKGYNTRVETYFDWIMRHVDKPPSSNRCGGQ